MSSVNKSVQLAKKWICIHYKNYIIINALINDQYQHQLKVYYFKEDGQLAVRHEKEITN